MKRYREVEDSSTTVVNGSERSSIGPDKLASSEEVEDSSTTVVNGSERSSIGPDKFASSEEAPGLHRRSE